MPTPRGGMARLDVPGGKVSTAEFFREHAACLRPGNASDHRQRVQEAYEAVRDKWLAERKYTALAKAIIGNWTSGNCVDYMAPLTRSLIGEGHAELHRHLWTRTLKRQVQAFLREYSFIRQGRPGYTHLMSLDTSGFVESDPGSYLDHERAAAFLLQRLVADIGRWRDELRSAGMDTADPDRIEQELREMKPPRIEVNRLPGG